MSVKTFKVAGVSLHNGKYKMRYANSKSRARVLEKNGHTNVELVVFKEALPKEDLVDHLLSRVFKDAKANEAILAEARELGFKV